MLRIKYLVFFNILTTFFLPIAVGLLLFFSWGDNFTRRLHRFLNTASNSLYIPPPACSSAALRGPFFFPFGRLVRRSVTEAHSWAHSSA